MVTGLAQALVAAGAVDAQEIAADVDRFGDGTALGRELISRGVVSERTLAESVAASTGTRFLDLAAVTIDPAVLALVPSSLCRRFQLLPIERSAHRLTVGIVDPTDLVALDDVSTATGLVVDPVVVARDALQTVFGRFLRSDEELTELSTVIEGASTAARTSFTLSLDEGDDATPVVRFVNLLIAQAITDRASDIHIEPGEADLTVRFRIDGVLHEVQRADRTIQDGVLSRLKIMAQIDIAEKRRPQDGRISVTLEGRTVDLRLATLPTVWGEKVVMRILDTSERRVSMAELLMSPGNDARFREAIRRPHGMVLVTGPTGSGKSTTLYTALSEIASPEVNVVTIEDPVEYRLPGISQMQVNPRAGLGFSTALRSILRADPDVLLVGEIRDRETAITSIEAALTGHLVLSTMHTNDAPSALTRLVEIGAEPYLVGTALTAVVAQRLARRLCVECRERADLDDETLQSAGFERPEHGVDAFYRPVGCRACSYTGYRGRVALHEVMTLSEDLEQQVVGRSRGRELRDIALAQGMVPLRDDGWAKVVAGITTIDEVLRVTA
ncbi:MULTISPECIES: GspE/PulE family protein [Microbacterium]|uniref:Type II secretion system protein E n=4 Tax=Microbacterium ginsengisoli TaxID=400772 RepID=A0A0F0M1G9_9MICO|nr:MULTISPECIES: GspE/PulE family protein [Microbacterium]KJL38169.1 Type II secretion system protein E [Microbacterium ginsengisoli]MCK9920006.1 GspE/PulE family protein [Microbacteriaceae bacterium K1510]